MLEYILKRLLLIVPLLFGVLTLVFLILHAMPGSVTQRILGEYATQESIAALEHKLGLDRPLVAQYGDFMLKYLRGDFGRSLRNRQRVIVEIQRELPYTLHLAVGGMIIATVIGLSIGTVSAIKPNSIMDNLSRVIALLGISMPVFWSGMLLIIIFSLRLGWFPIIGVGEQGNIVDMLYHLVLPSITVGWLSAAVTMRMTRSSMLEVLGEDYIRTAYAKGLSSKIVFFKHALRNASIPIVTIIGLNFGTLLGGAILTETVFARRGIGTLIVDAVLWKDFPVAQASIFTFAAMFSLVNLMTDLSYGLLDPRIRYE
ncbi:MAG: ABC transporter permease [Methanothrix sp.]|nr:MAG: ABC transporter permease [Methanothrix sp.]